MKSFYLRLVLLLFFAFSPLVKSSAQTERQSRFDSLFFDSFLYPSVSVSILPKGFWEVNSFSTLLTATKKFNEHTDAIENNLRTSIFNELIQLTYGASKKGNFNIGLDVNYTSFRLDLDQGSSPLKALSSKEAFAFDKYVSHAGLRVKYLPFRRKRDLLIQHTLELPIDNYQNNPKRINTQIVYVNALGNKWFLYNQLDFKYFIPKNQQKGSWLIPYTAVLSFLVKPDFQLFGIGNYTFLLSNAGNSSVNFLQAGGGAQYQLTNRLGFNLFVTRYMAGKNIDQFSSINLGIRGVI